MRTGVIKQVGRYIVAEAIGQGSFGKVYKGIDQFDKSEVALKFISKRGKNKKQLEGLRAQNQMLKKICHKNIIKLLGFHETDNQMIIVTQFAGENLSDVLERKKKFSYEEVRVICKQIFDALCYLDENRIAHRDLKPQNILVQNQVIKLCDFGFARKLSASTNFMNSLKGTPLYIAPQILGNGPLNYTKKVDIWSFGIIIFELFAGRPPFYAQNLPKLKPKILHERVRFPKQMPLELKSLIDRMLQKNADSRADWEQLKKSPFFTNQAEPLMQVPKNIPKVEAQKQQYLRVVEQPMLAKEQSQKQAPANIDKKAKLNRLASLQDVEQIKKLEVDMLAGKVDIKSLRVDNSFYEKVMSIYSSYLSGEGLVTKQGLCPITSIFLHMFSKIKLYEVDCSKDIIRRKQLLFCVIKLAEQDTDPETLSNELMMIGFLIKNNFDNTSIDFQTDQDILEICVREVQANRSSQCFGNALTLLGTLANQGILTINNSEDFFIRVEKEQILASVAEAYEHIPSKRIILQCIERFIHPNQFPAHISKNHYDLRNAFVSMKQQVARVLLQRKFLIYNPLTIYKDPLHVDSYAKILYECITVSDAFRKEFLKSNYWLQFLQHKNLRVFCFAYDYVCFQKDKVNLIPNELMKDDATDSVLKNSYMGKAFYFARVQNYLAKKTASINKQDSTLNIIRQIEQCLNLDTEVRKKASREVEGFLSTGPRLFQEVLSQIFCNFLNDPVFDKSSIPQGMLVSILQNLLNAKTQEELKISPMTASRLIIVSEELIKIETPNFKQNKRIFSVLFSIITYFLQNGLIFQIQNEQGVSHTKKLLLSIMNITKVCALDQKQQLDMYGRMEEKGVAGILVSGGILDKESLAFCLTILQKLSTQAKYANSVIDFTSLTLIQKLKPYLSLDLDDSHTETVVMVLHMLSLVIKKSQEYAQKIKQLEIIQHFPRYLQHPSNENIRHQTLTLIGNMAKHSQYFFQDFANFGIFVTIADTFKRYGSGNRNRILKGIIYAIGNVSFYTDKFYKQFTVLIPALYTALTTDDVYLVSNTMSTISNLLRHSNCYVRALTQQRIIKKVIQIVMESSKPDNKMMFGLNMIKKVLVYPEIFEEHPKAEFVAIYTHKSRMVPEDNECMRKIRTFM